MKLKKFSVRPPSKPSDQFLETLNGKNDVDVNIGVVMRIFQWMEPGYRSLILCHRPGRSCVPASRGSVGILSVSIMNPFCGLSDQVEVQMKIEQSQRGRVGRQYA